MASTPLVFLSSYQAPDSRLNATLQAWLPVLLCSSIFVIESTATFGADHTSAPLHNLCQLLIGTAVDRDWSNIHHIIRKTGHFTGYGTFSLVCFRGFWLSLRKWASRIHAGLTSGLARQCASHVLAIAATFLVAGADELHQSFLPNRTGLFSDVLLDTTGALTLQVLLFLILGAIALWRKSPANSADSEDRSEPQRRLPRAA